ncbi:hypothetical protein MLD38_009313 [Melastoma candidum]|uniref:Uncharacterized protein n=1 Tax=Melastoma candidum TaxID=119954 RepID=A0ACB9S0U5_9MYRT|nr:hypothetical protein MLD38_009313 [Melastoma candidum]
MHSTFVSSTPLSPPFLFFSTAHRRRRPDTYPTVLCSSSSTTSTTEDAPTPSSNVFGEPKELNAVQSIVKPVSLPTARLVASVVLVAGAVAAGYGVGVRIGGGGPKSLAATGGAVVAGAAAGGCAYYAAKAVVPEIASVELRNHVVAVGAGDGDSDGAGIKREDIDEIARKYGVSKQDEAFNAELSDIYLMFVTSVLPPGGQELRGDEVDKIVKFKSALGIDDPDAAAMHIEIGRRSFRQRLETGDREAEAEQRRAFQKLIYVSTLVFGDASTFLLPWKRVFKITDSQVEVAIRDNAQRLYASKLKAVGRDLDAELLVSLREAQLMYRLSDELAADLFKGHTRKLVEDDISSALIVLKSRTRAPNGAAQAIVGLNKVLSFNNSLVTLKAHPNADRFAPGVGPVSLIGGEYDSDRKMEDLKLLYRSYLSDSLLSGRMEESKLDALSQLRNIFGLGKREAEAIKLDVTSKVYRQRLAQAVSGGDLEAADSKAAFLQRLCEELHFDPQKAGEIHEEIYRQKLQQCVGSGELSEEDVKALLRLRVMLCIPQQTVEAAHSSICGSLFEKVVREAIASGVDGYDADVKNSVRKAAHGLRLTREAAMSIASKAVRTIFINYVKRARAAQNRTESAKELKKMIAFNTLVVTELVADIKGESTDTKAEDDVKEVKQQEEEEDDEGWESIQTLKKIRPSKELAAKMGKQGQTEITLKDDLPERDRMDLYKIYLLFCLTGEVTRIGFGAEITTKRDDSEFVLLNQLGGILGLTQKEIVDVHRGLAEQAFRQQAEVILADGQLTKARVEQLNDLQQKVGLPQEYAQKVIKNITTTKMAAAIETAVSQGRLNIKQMRELKETGTGEFDEEEVYTKIPADLKINVEKARLVVQELAKNRLSNSLIQAVSLLRQRNRQGVVSSLNDLLACDKAVPSEPLSWDVQEELADLFAIYSGSDPSPNSLSRLQYLLGISESTAAALREMGDRAVPLASEEQEFLF